MLPIEGRCQLHILSILTPHLVVTQATSAAVGYLLLAVEKVALLMGGPLLHEGRFQGSTSSIWQPHSFWHREPAGGAVLPLVATNSSGSSGASISATTSSSRCV